MSKPAPKVTKKKKTEPASGAVSLSELRSKARNVGVEPTPQELAEAVKSAQARVSGQPLDQSAMLGALQTLAAKHKVLPKRLQPLQQLILAEIAQPLRRGKYFVLDHETLRSHEYTISPADKEEVLQCTKEKIDVKELEAYADVCDWTRLELLTIWHRLEAKYVHIYFLICSPWHVREGIDVAAYRQAFTPADLATVLDAVREETLLEMAWLTANVISENKSLKRSKATQFISAVQLAYLIAGQILALDKAAGRGLANLPSEIPRIQRMKLWVKQNWKLLLLAIFCISGVVLGGLFGLALLIRALAGG